MSSSLRICPKGHDKDITGRYSQGQCKICTDCSQVKKKKSRRELLNKIKDEPCMDCGIKYPPFCMDFDHRDQVDKIDDVGLMYLANLEKLLEEIEKCDLVCANCHRIRTNKQQTKEGTK